METGDLRLLIHASNCWGEAQRFLPLPGLCACPTWQDGPILGRFGHKPHRLRSGPDSFWLAGAPDATVPGHLLPHGCGVSIGL